MQRFRHQRGEGQFGCVIALLLLLGAIFIAYKMIPVKVKAAELRGEIIDEAKSASNRSDARIISNILLVAERNDMPVTKENIQVSRTGTRIRVEVDYTVPVEFPGYTYNWHFRHVAENPLF